MSPACFCVHILLAALFLIAPTPPLVQAQQEIPAEILQQLPPELQQKALAAQAAGKIPDTSAPAARLATPTANPISKPVQPAGTSRLESIFRSNYRSSMADGLKQYGYELFSKSRAHPSQLAVPDPSYILGPGDELSITIWGSTIGGSHVRKIGREGTVDIPQLGVIPLGGVRFGDVEQVIRAEAEKYIQGINLSVALSGLRSMEIYVIGDVASPGLHVIPAFSTVLDGLLSAGGVTKSGSLRSISIRRGNRTVKTMDLYDLLRTGNRSSDIFLESRDVIFVPRIGPTAAVVGASTDQGIFELRGERTVGDILELAGGIMPQAFSGRIHLRRFGSNAEFVVKDIDTTTPKQTWAATPVENGDLIELRYVQSANPRIVSLEGHLWRPDVFQFTPGMRLSRILRSPDQLKPEAVTEFAYLHRYNEETTRYELSQFSPEAVFKGEYDTELHPYDRITVLSRQDLGISEHIEIHGAVWKPGTYAYQPGMTLQDLVSLAGGTRFGGNPARIEHSRQQVIGDRIDTTHTVLDLASAGNTPVRPYDYVFVPTVKDATLIRTVTLSGEVMFPGTYRIKDGEHLSDLIRRAGGFTDQAYFYGARFTSPRARQIQQHSLDQLIRDLEIRANQTLAEQAQIATSKEDAQIAQAMQTGVRGFIDKLRTVKADGRVSIVLSDLTSFQGSSYDFPLDDGDALAIPKRPNFVAVTGSVYSPSAYLYQSALTVGDYLEKSGGPTKTADLDYAYVLRANGEVYSSMQHGSLLNSFERVRLMPGDTLVIPENLERVPYLRMVQNVSDIVFKIATTAGIAIAAL